MGSGPSGLMIGPSVTAPQEPDLGSGPAAILPHLNPGSIVLDLTLKPSPAREPIAPRGLHGASGEIVNGLVEIPTAIGRDLARPRNLIAQDLPWKPRLAMKVLVILVSDEF